MSIFSVSSNFTRPNDTTAYDQHDLVANSTTAGSVTPLSWGVPLNSKIWRAVIVKSGATATNASFILNLFGASPTVANGDNGALSHTRSKFLDKLALDATSSKASDECVIAATFSVPVFNLGYGTVYGLLQANAAYTPTAQEVFTVFLIGE